MLYNRMTKIAIDPNHKEALTNKQIVVNIYFQNEKYIFARTSLYWDSIWHGP